MSDTWTTIERPGYFGARRDAIHARYDATYGAGRWRLAWQVGEQTVGRDGMQMLYEDAYMAYLVGNPDVCDRLCAEASEVYDDEITNIASGLDYSIQETARTHVQDIAIRRCIVRLGRSFRGAAPIRIRHDLGDHELSMTLSPGMVPFHRPDLLVKPELSGWWQPASVESFYQSNKLLQTLT